MQQIKSNKGGKRAGAGRPKLTGGNIAKSRHVKLTDSDYQKVKDLGGLAKVIKSIINSPS